MPDLSPLMLDAMCKEFALAHDTQPRANVDSALHAELDRYRRLLGGISACATQCPCCKMLSELAQEALEEYRRGS